MHGTIRLADVEFQSILMYRVVFTVSEIIAADVQNSTLLPSSTRLRQ